jgi:ribosomal protein S18 acetylase RimI-like enzyme
MPFFMTMEFVFIDESYADDASAFVHDMWVDTYAPIIVGGRSRAEDIFDDWVGPDKIRSDMAIGHDFIFIVQDGETIGLLSAGKEGGDYVISKIYILPEQRGKGVGTAALKFLLEKGMAMGCSRAVLEVNPNNTSAINMYKVNGFCEIGRNQYDHGYTLLLALDLKE